MKTSFREVSNAAATNDWRSIPSIIALVFVENAKLRAQATKTVDRLAQLIPPSALPGFEARLRESTWQAYSWHELRIADVRCQHWPTFLWAMLTFHPNGYNREEAIRRIAASDGAVLPFLLLRLNDWVPQVRVAAMGTVRARLDGRYLADWLPVLGLLDALRSRSRHDHEWLNHEVANLLWSSQSHTAFEQALLSREPRIARWAMKAAMALPEAERPPFIMLGLEHVDPVCRLCAASVVASWRECPGRAQLLRKMKVNRSMNVRREALYAMLEAPDAERRDWLESSLLDRHRSIREAAQHYLLRDDRDFDARRYYANAIEHAPVENLAFAVAGLGETGQKQDGEMLVSLVQHPHPKVAAAAVRAIAKLDASSRIDWLVRLLVDARPTVAREAMRALLDAGSILPYKAIQGIVRTAPQGFSSLYALKVLLRRHPYEALADALSAASHRDPMVVKAATDFIAEYLRRPFHYSPTDTQRKAIEDSLSVSLSSLPEEILARVRMTIR